MIIALIIFITAFVVLVIWALKRPKDEIHEMEMLPLEDEDKPKKEENQ